MPPAFILAMSGKMSRCRQNATSSRNSGIASRRRAFFELQTAADKSGFAASHVRNATCVESERVGHATPCAPSATCGCVEGFTAFGGGQRTARPTCWLWGRDSFNNNSHNAPAAIMSSSAWFSPVPAQMSKMVSNLFCRINSAVAVRFKKDAARTVFGVHAGAQGARPVCGRGDNGFAAHFFRRVFAR